MLRSAVFLKSRATVLGLASALAFGTALFQGTPKERSLDGLAAMLAEAASGAVERESIVWEPSPGFLAETFYGRRVLFLATPAHTPARDVYRARVRLTLDGSPIEVEQVKNLTATPHGDDVGLESSGERAVFATLAFGRIQALSILETVGIRAADRPRSVLHRGLLAFSSWQQTGSPQGIGRTDILLDVPARGAKITLDPLRLGIDFGERGRELVYDLEPRQLRAADGSEAYAARALPEIHGEKPPLLWLVDTVRAEVGPEPIAWLESVVFGARDSVRRTTYSLFAAREKRALHAGADEPRARVLEASAIAGAAENWPPPRIPSLWKEPQRGEGEWEPVSYGFLKSMRGTLPQSGSPPPYFQRTFIRPDPERPYSKVMLVAMDMRQLELGMQAGYEDPKPTTGPPGEGRLPRDPNIYERVVATFNGAFKTTHGEYGMMVQRRVLLPPVAGGASLIVNDAQEVGLGSWPKSAGIPDDLVSFRQNLDPLVEDGVPNPTGRKTWGWQLEGTSVMTQRSGICVTAAGHLYYAFAPEIDGRTFGKALYQAGCSYALHLDMNPGHCGFVYTDVRDLRSGNMTLRLAHEEMRISPDKYTRWSSKDFFYVMVRDATPHDASSIHWEPDSGTQPPPAWLPGIFGSKLTLGSLEVELFSIEKGRVDYRLRAGAREFGGPRKAAVGRGFVDSEAGRVIGAIGVGHTTDATRYGLAYGAEVLSPLKPHYATLLLQDHEVPLLVRAGSSASTLRAGQQAVQLPLLAEDSKLLDRARERGDLRLRAALCVTPTGRVIVGRVQHDSSDGIAAALLRVGCRDVVELDRGSHHPGFFHRGGTSTPPMDGYDASVLYLLSRPMQPHAFRWKPQGGSPSTHVTSYDTPGVARKAGEASRSASGVAAPAPLK